MGCGAVLTTAAVLVAGCGQEAAEPLTEEKARPRWERERRGSGRGDPGAGGGTGGAR